MSWVTCLSRTGASTRKIAEGEQARSLRSLDSQQVGSHGQFWAGQSQQSQPEPSVPMTNSRAGSSRSGLLTSRDTGATKPQGFDSSTTAIKGMSGRRQDRKQVDLASTILASELCLRLPDPSPPCSMGWRAARGRGPAAHNPAGVNQPLATCKARRQVVLRCAAWCPFTPGGTRDK
jgi:hypothetical protein